ncbi:homeobox protein Hox-C4a-like isoform X3 [Alosa alosa]|uniref:homeobox protein Hox-C4a-like isoform X3 n=1 Tax=Alosa sapidissima TaxID=34773 RepID=UPI001C092B43|nr:homeobox protein Hox-C4a-like isoform X3 [Alosa sapidissima]XP_048096638.1 homeobox protein Hox-C4a-like isoform X3 [Alosa alosa]
MIMSSYLMDSNYIDPKFPPCEEYSQNSYIPDHSPEYYNRARDTGYQHHHQELYPPRSSYQERQYSCPSIPEPETQRGHGLPLSGHLLAGKGQPASCEPQLPMSPSTPPAASAACNQATPEHPNSTASAKQPVVYPWMKKIHVSTGRKLVSFCAPSSALILLHLPLSACLTPYNPYLLSSPCYDRIEAFEMAQLRWIYDSALRIPITMERKPSGLELLTPASRF